MSILDKKISRKDFVKGSAAIAAGLAVMGPGKAMAAGMTFKDNIRSGVVISATAPADKGSLWIDTGSGGVVKYYTGSSWENTKAVWG